MIIHLRVEGTEPPVGSVGLAEAAARPFVGWVELLRLLSELLDEDPTRRLRPG